MWDIYSATIRCMYNRYKEEDISKMYDRTVCLDFEIVNNAVMTPMEDDARKMAKELQECLREEILYRMGRFRLQASMASEALYQRLLEFGE